MLIFAHGDQTCYPAILRGYLICVVMKKRKVFDAVPNHCYQRSVNNQVIFYSISDFLLFFTVFCTAARRYPIVVLKLVLMYDHLHHSTLAPSTDVLSAFIRDYTSIFVREYNPVCHRKGALFQMPYGSAPKFGDKKIRSNLIYLDNNPVERKLSKFAEDYQWNFLAYGNDDYPFSTKILLRKASMPLRRALKRVKSIHKSGHYLTYTVLQNLFKSLPYDYERRQLTDFIINLYSVIDHEAAIRFFGSYQNEVLAAHSTTGSEYDINEVFIGKSDACYNQMSAILRKEGQFDDIHDVLTLPLEEKMRWFQVLCRKTHATKEQIAGFLHMPPPPGRGDK